MFTARIIYPELQERIIEVQSVMKELYDGWNTSNKTVRIRLKIDDNSDELVDEGEVYIMNENGKTVASYILGQRMQESNN